MVNYFQKSSKRLLHKIVHIMQPVWALTDWPPGPSPAFLALLACLLAPMLTGCAWLGDKQRAITYRPTPGIPADFAGLRPQDQRFFVTVPADAKTNVSGLAQQVEMWWLPHTNPQAPTLLYLHGTFRNLYQNLHKIDSLRAAGFSIVAVDYRGWGQSSAIIPFEDSIMHDAHLALAELQKRELRPSHRFIYGHSMGSGVAVALASQLQAPSVYGGLILESAFTSFSDIAREVGFVGYLASLVNTERFESLLKIPQVNAPVLMLHGSADTTVPIVLGKYLFDAAREPKNWVPIAGGSHSNLNQEAPALYLDAIQRFKLLVTAATAGTR